MFKRRSPLRRQSSKPAAVAREQPSEGARQIRGRVAPEDYSSETPTEPDVQIFRILCG